MSNRRLLIIVGCSLFVTCSGFAAQAGLAARLNDTWPLHRETGSSDTVMIAEKSGDDNAETMKGRVQDRKAKPEDDRAAQQQIPTSGGQADPLTPFEPSEKVPADQTVDFPYDI